MSIESAILQWITDVTGLSAYQAPMDNSKDKPSGDYCTFQIIAIVMSDFNQENNADKDADFIAKTTKNNALVTISFNVFSYKGYQKIVDLNASSSFWEYRKQLADEGVTVNRLGNPQNLTGLGDTNFVDRWQADIEFRVTMQNENDWHKVKAWQLGGRFISDDGNDVISLVKWPN